MINLYQVWKNLATNIVVLELTEAGVPCMNVTPNTIANTSVGGILRFGGGQCVSFKRHGSYWEVLLAKPFPYRFASRLNYDWKREVRVDGLPEGGLPEREGVSVYEVDTQKGLNALVKALKSHYGVYRERTVRKIENLAKFEFEVGIQLAEFYASKQSLDLAIDVLQQLQLSKLAEQLPASDARTLEAKMLWLYIDLLDRSRHLTTRSLPEPITNPLKTGEKQFEDFDLPVGLFAILCMRYASLVRLEALGVKLGSRLTSTRRSLQKWAAHVVSVNYAWRQHRLNVLDELVSCSEDLDDISFAFAVMHATQSAALEILEVGTNYCPVAREYLKPRCKTAARLYGQYCREQHLVIEAVESGNLNLLSAYQASCARRYAARISRPRQDLHDSLDELDALFGSVVEHMNKAYEIV